MNRMEIANTDNAAAPSDLREKEPLPVIFLFFRWSGAKTACLLIE
jgi:hypothetical protein